MLRVSNVDKSFGTMKEVRLWQPGFFCRLGMEYDE